MLDPNLRALLLPYASVDLDAAYHQFCQETGQVAYDQFMLYMYQRQWLRYEAFQAMQRAPGAGGVAAGQAPAAGRYTPGAVGKASSFQQTYRLDRSIGAGGMGEVFLARDEVLRRPVAYKRLKPGMPPDVAGRFLDEAQITAQLAHPNIVPVYGLEARPDGTAGYAMKCIEGKELGALIRERRERLETKQPIGPDQTLEALLGHFLHVCDAISYAHSRGVLHRDLKPENIMVGGFGEVYVMDWGVARLIAGAKVPREKRVTLGGLDDRPPETGRTLTGQSIGTPAFMSPEQARGKNKELDGRSDQYALGLILHEIVCLKPAVTGDTRFEVLTKAVEGSPDPIRPAIPGLGRIDKRLRAIIEKATARQPEIRYLRVADLAEDVRRFLRDEPILARPDSLLGRLGRGLRRHLALAALLVLVAVCGLAGFGLLSLLRQQQLEHRQLGLSRLLARVSERAHRIDAHLLETQGGVEALAQAARQALLHGKPADAPIFSSRDFDAAAGAPPTVRARSYGKRVSFEHPAYKAAPGVNAGRAAETVRRLSPLAPLLASLVAPRTAGESAAAWRERVASEGGPARWAFVATETGVHVSFPGKGGYPDDYDPRRRPWYALGRGQTRGRWGAPYEDAQGQGLLFPCAVGIFGRGGAPIGVAGLDVSVRYVASHLLPLAEVPGAWASALLDREGRVVVASIGGRVEGGDRIGEPFAVKEVAQAVKAGRMGAHFVQVDGIDAVAVLAPIGAVGWTYLAWGPEAGMLGVR